MNIVREQIGFSVQNILEESVSCGNADGLQCAAFLNGELIVNAWAGRLRKNSRNEVGPNTLFPIFSAGKAIASAAALRLVERGEFRAPDDDGGGTTESIENIHG